MSESRAVKQKRYRDKHHDAHVRNKHPLNVVKLVYSNMRRRTMGLDQRTPLSHGMELGFTRDEFIDWTFKNSTFLQLFRQWTAHQYERRWAPSIDRLNDELGYVFPNIRWVVWFENHTKPRVRRTHSWKAAKYIHEPVVRAISS
jgi:hypothetical protein